MATKKEHQVTPRKCCGGPNPVHQPFPFSMLKQCSSPRNTGQRSKEEKDWPCCWSSSCSRCPHVPPASPAPPDCPAQPGPARQSQAAASPGHRRHCQAGASPRPGVLTPSAGKIRAQNTSEVTLEKGKEREETKKSRWMLFCCQLLLGCCSSAPLWLPVLAPVPAGPPPCAGASSCWVHWSHLQWPQ